MGAVFLHGQNGGAGCTLTVTAPAGATVTISKDGKTKTKTADSSGVAVFKGLESGVWEVSATYEGQVNRQNVTIEADYTIDMTSLVLFAGDGSYRGEWQGKAVWYISGSQEKKSPTVSIGNTLSASLATSQSMSRVGVVANNYPIPQTIQRIYIELNSVSPSSGDSPLAVVAAWIVDKLDDGFTRLVTLSLNGATNNTLSLDLSNVTSTSYLVIAMYTPQAKNAAFFDIQSIVGVCE